MPLPPRQPSEFFGFQSALQPTDRTTQRIDDFSFEGGLLGVTLSGGFKLDAVGQPTSIAELPQYRTILAPSGELPAGAGKILYPDGARPKRVSIVPNASVTVDGVTQVRNLALV